MKNKELPEHWDCSLNPDEAYARCEVAQEQPEDSQVLWGTVYPWVASREYGPNTIVYKVDHTRRSADIRFSCLSGSLEGLPTAMCGLSLAAQDTRI